MDDAPRLRLAIVRQRYNPFGGAERFIERAIEALRARQVDVTMITRAWTSDPARPALVCDPFYLGSLWRDWGFARAACREAAAARFDLVQSHERLHCCDVFRAGDGVHRQWLRHRARGQGAWRRLATALDPHHRYVLAAERRMFASPRLRAVICNSRMVRDEIARGFGVPDHKLHVIYNGVDTTRYSPALREKHRPQVRAKWSIPAQAMLFLFVGAGFARKGLAVALSALAATDGWLLVAGGDKRAARFAAQARALGIADRVVFAGPQREVWPLYLAADAFVLPTVYDPFPNAILEALACGLPVLTSTACGAAELVVPAGAGHAHEALDVAAFASSMRALTDAGIHARCSQAALDLARTLTFDRMTAAYVDLYAHLGAAALPS